MTFKKPQTPTTTPSIEALVGLLDSVGNSGAEDVTQVVDVVRGALVRPGQLDAWAVQATPRLVEACATKSSGRGPLLRLLADVAVFGVHTWWLDEGYNLTERWFEEVAEDHPAKATHLAVEGGTPTYLAILTTGTPDERIGAAFLLAFLSRRATSTLAPVWATATDESASIEVRATAFITAGYLLKYLGSSSGDLEAALAAETQPLLRLAATIALAKANASALEPPDIDTLKNATTGAKDWNGKLPWCDGALDLFVMLTLARVAFTRGDVSTLEQLTQGGAATPLGEKLAVLLSDAVLGAPSDDPALITAADQAPRAQVHVIEMLIDLRLLHAVELPRRGVFGSHYALLRYLGRTEQGPMDRVVGEEPVWRVFFEQLRHGEDDSAFVERVTQGRSPDDLVALALDMAFSTYTTYPPLPSSAWGDDPLEYYARVQRLASRIAARATRETLETAMAQESKTADVSSKASVLITAWHELTSGAPLPEVADPLIVAAMQPEYREAVLPVLQALPQPRVERALLKAGFRFRKTGRGAELVGAWSFVEACPTKAILEAVIQAVDGCTDKIPEGTVIGVLAKLGPALPALLKRAAIRNSPRKPVFQAALERLSK